MLKDLTPKKILPYYVVGSIVFVAIGFSIAITCGHLLPDVKLSTFSLYHGIVEIFGILFILSAVIFTIVKNGFDKQSIINTWKKDKFISLAILFCAIAEILKFVPVVSPFALGGFFITWIFLISYTFKIKKFKKKHLIPLLIFALISVIYYFTFHWELQAKTGLMGLLYKIFVPLYILLLTLGVWTSFCFINERKSIFYIIGCLIFFLSDLIVINEVATGTTNPTIFFLVWITYLPAIFLISFTDAEFLNYKI